LNALPTVPEGVILRPVTVVPEKKAYMDEHETTPVHETARRASKDGDRRIGRVYAGALEMLNPPMKSWAAYEIARQDAEANLGGVRAVIPRQGRLLTRPARQPEQDRDRQGL